MDTYSTRSHFLRNEKKELHLENEYMHARHSTNIHYFNLAISYVTHSELNQISSKAYL